MDPFNSAASHQMHDEDSTHFPNGPLPGDLDEVEAFCRIFRIAEEVHNAVMEALLFANKATEFSQPQTDGNDNGTCSEDAEVLEDGDVSLLEDKVVSALGCIGALLHQQKEEVLGGRLGLGNLVASQHDSIPPLAQFRAEMKRCCEQLEAALSCYFPAVEERFTMMHRKLQKLKNICFDAGYSRAEGSPSHADIPNWGGVRLWTPQVERMSEPDDGIVFWRGGQSTEEGLHWLIDKGFKVIVDLRAETSGDQLAKSALSAAIASGKIRQFRLPVDQGSSPTKDQVLEFAKLVVDPQNRPLYLHSQEGVSRTSSMAARWRELALRSDSQMDAINEHSSSMEVPSVQADKELQENSSQLESGNPLHAKSKYENGSPNEELDATRSNEISGEQFTFLEEITTSRTPYEAQRPVLNLFSKRSMSKFLKGRQVSPASFQWNRKVRKMAKLNSFQGDKTVSLKTTIGEPAGRWGLDGPGIPRAGRKEDDSLMSDGNIGSCPSVDGAGDLAVPNISSSFGVTCAGISSTGEQEEMGSPTNGASSSALTKGALFRVSGLDGSVEDTEEPSVVGNMCASTTGVVRLQSRKKAEMYLVRTDGFSCTREKVKESTLAFTHPSTQQQMLMWKTAPKTVLLLKKLGNELMQVAQQVASFLHYHEGMNVIVEPEVHDHFARVTGFGFVQTFYNQDTSNLHERIDFVVCLGGDGVILHASNLFRNAVPPVVSFNLGSLGFLTAHPFEDFTQDLRAIIHGNSRVEGVYITLRMRLRCELFRNGKPVPGKIFEVLNEVVLDRGSNPYICKIECFERNRLITKVQADGVIVATPTGSTAYSTAAGGSMVHPNVPCMLFTPICPHSLSFRPVILPDSALLELKVPNDARSNVWVSFDGKKRQQLSRGDSVRICMSEHPLPTVNKSDQTDDWFRSLVRCLNWNERLEQKRL